VSGGLEAQRRLLEMGEALIAWKRRTLEVYAALPADAPERALLDCLLVDRIDVAIRTLVDAAAWPPAAGEAG